jgi:prevent-host-death family protein
LKSISTSDLRSQLTSILENLTDGGPICITKHGKTVAVILAATADDGPERTLEEATVTINPFESFEHFSAPPERETDTFTEMSNETWLSYEDGLDEHFEEFLKTIKPDYQC